MKTLLPKNNLCSFLTLGLLIGCFQLSAQQLQKQYQGPLNKGHALYKSTKIYDSKTGPVGVKPKRIGDRAIDRWIYEKGMLQNPYTQEIPKNIHQAEALFSKNIPASKMATENQTSKGRSRVGTYRPWGNRGPGNVGGRTRALALDRKNENIVFAGGVSGGLYRSTDLGQTWDKITRNFQSPSITAIEQDPRPGKENIWYYVSGERFGNSASASGAFYQGSGIYKSLNGGKNFFLLRDTNDNDVTTISAFDIINSIEVHPKTGDVYVGTFEGIYRSRRGWGNFEPVLFGGFNANSEVMITPSGKIYATLDTIGEENAGFYVSSNGVDYDNITPPGIPPTFGRTVMAYDPSDENRVYFFSFNFGPESEAFLWRYQADAATPEEQWVDLSANLPLNLPGIAAALNLQGAYNMVIEVHPTNPDIVFVGGTNLYRSFDGFTTPVGLDSRIGGYTIFADSFALYPNHHPDQHNMAFLPSNPNRVITANDGGVQITEDITQTEAPVEWTSLNNNYITTQPYAISFDPEANSNDLLAGFQDNGTWFTDSESLNDPWIEDFSGDGTYNAIADGGLTRYVSAQFGVTFRFNFDEDGNFVSFTRVQPAGASGFSFVAPFILDPNNDNIMYYPAGNVMWRNDNLDNIPLFSNALATEGWNQLSQTAVPNGAQITALDVSTFPIANTLYYGTQDGQIFKMENANLDGQKVEDVSTGRGLPPGNVNNIYVDPKNPDRVFAVFSNYNIPSVFMTRDGGETWKDISGNLEENRDGTGNGPSVRWFAMLGKNNGYFVGTSTGLYFTRQLQGRKTYWRRIYRVGDNVIPQVRTRKDGFVAAAAHGNGVFSANFWVDALPEPKLSVANLIDDITLPIGFPETVTIDLEQVFESTRKKADINYELTNSNPSLVNAVLDGSTLSFTITSGLEGSSSIGIIARSGREKVSEGFKVNVIEPAIYEQVDAAVTSSPSQFFLDFGGLAQSADDFIVPEGSTWKINRVVAFGAANNSPILDNVSVSIYADAGGVPGDEIYSSGDLTPISDPSDTNLNIELPDEVELTSGSYWLSVYTNLAFNPNATQWFWFKQAQVIGNESAFRDVLDLFVTGAVDWTPQSQSLGGAPSDQIFQIFGMVENATEAADEPLIAASETNEVLSNNEAVEQSLAELNTNVLVSVWPNPSSQNFEFTMIEAQDQKVTTRIYNILGQLVHEIKDQDTSRSFNWNASRSPAGVYFVKISGQKTNSSFKLVKK
ncbi:T9SS type A sorting domain-containing protein [Allomuricauda sp. d1]|uniref:T9SS type A sorting domain-containing protein n=1 Tax=Allomuricauda sp. d1 TaxID=3136725 RepID=UPI0031E02391